MNTDKTSYPQHLDVDALLDEAQVERPIEYLVTFVFSDGTNLTLPFTTAEKVTLALRTLLGKSGIILFHSAEPVPSAINMDLLVCVTPHRQTAE